MEDRVKMLPNMMISPHWIRTTGKPLVPWSWQKTATLICLPLNQHSSKRCRFCTPGEHICDPSSTLSSLLSSSPSTNLNFFLRMKSCVRVPTAWLKWPQDITAAAYERERYLPFSSFCSCSIQIKTTNFYLSLLRLFLILLSKDSEQLTHSDFKLVNFASICAFRFMCTHIHTRDYFL